MNIFYGIKNGNKIWERIKIIHRLHYRGETWAKRNDSVFWDGMIGWIMVFFWVVRGKSRWEARF